MKSKKYMIVANCTLSYSNNIIGAKKIYYETKPKIEEKKNSFITKNILYTLLNVIDFFLCNSSFIFHNVFFVMMNTMRPFQHIKLFPYDPE